MCAPCVPSTRVDSVRKCDTCHGIRVCGMLSARMTGNSSKCDVEHSIGRPCVRLSVSAPIESVRKSGAAKRAIDCRISSYSVGISESVTEITVKWLFSCIAHVCGRIRADCAIARDIRVKTEKRTAKRVCCSLFYILYLSRRDPGKVSTRPRVWARVGSVRVWAIWAPVYPEKRRVCARVFSHCYACILAAILARVYALNRRPR